MSNWLVRFAMTGPAIVGAWPFVSPTDAAQASKNRPVVAGCPSVSAAFHPCALAKAQTFNPPRTPEGDPDLQGIWDAPTWRGRRSANPRASHARRTTPTRTFGSP